MPKRNIVLANGQVYHVYNRALDGKNLFTDTRILNHAELVLWFYRYHQLPIPLSRYLNLPAELKTNLYHSLKNTSTKVYVYSYCLMSNHFHLLLEQVRDNGISTYLSNFQNSFTKYYNFRTRRTGSIFQNQFKAVRVETEAQLIHISRYIHLNPLTSYLIREPNHLNDYTWSSFNDYVNVAEKVHQVTETKLILGIFKNRKKYQEFVFNNADYQRQLDRIKHLIIEH